MNSLVTDGANHTDYHLEKRNHVARHEEEDVGVIEEERRLAYVAITRASDELILSSRDQIKGKVNFEIKTDSLLQPQIDILFQKMLSILEPHDIVSSFNWKAIQSFKDLFNCSYGIIFDKEEELFQAQSLSNHDEDLFFMAHHTLIDSRNFDLPKNKTVLWTVNDELDFQRYMELDINGIVTDIPDTMQLYRK